MIYGMTTGWWKWPRQQWPPLSVTVLCQPSATSLPHGKSSTLKRLFAKASCAPRRRPAPTRALTFNGEESRIPRASFPLKCRRVGSRGLGLRFSLPALRSCRPPPPGCSPGFHMVPVCEEGAVGFPAVRRVYLPALGEAQVFSPSRKVKVSLASGPLCLGRLWLRSFSQRLHVLPETALGRPHQALPQGSGSRRTWASPVRSVLAGPAFPESPES